MRPLHARETVHATDDAQGLTEKRRAGGGEERESPYNAEFGVCGGARFCLKSGFMRGARLVEQESRFCLKVRFEGERNRA